MEFKELFSAAGLDGWLHAHDLRSGRELSHQADAPVVAASVFKLPVLVSLYRAADAGDLGLGEAVEVPAEGRAAGPTGLSAMRDAARWSWRDLALSMMMVSDNAATDVICARLGLDGVGRTLQELGLKDTAVPQDCAGIFRSMSEDAGVACLAEIPDPPPAPLAARLRALDPAQTNRTTARDAARLLALIWNDAAASPAACADMRRILTAQVWPHRLAAGFPEDEVRTAGKTGTLWSWRNEAGVVSYADGRQVVVTVFTRARQLRRKNAQQDAAIGRAARMAVDRLLS